MIYSGLSGPVCTGSLIPVVLRGWRADLTDFDASRYLTAPDPSCAVNPADAVKVTFSPPAASGQKLTTLYSSSSEKNTTKKPAAGKGNSMQNAQFLKDFEFIDIYIGSGTRYPLITEIIDAHPQAASWCIRPAAPEGEKL
jgi:hypothetical protein